MFLKKSLISALLLISITSLPALAADHSLQLQLKSDTVALGAHLPGQLTLINTSNHEIVVPVDKSHYAHPSGFVEEVRDSHGNTPPWTLSAIVVVSSGWAQSVKPGESVEYKVDPFEFFKITKPGTYTVWEREVDSDGKTILESNKVTVSVTE